MTVNAVFLQNSLQFSTASGSTTQKTSQNQNWILVGSFKTSKFNLLFIFLIDSMGYLPTFG
jgi:hypothetical protein